MYSLKSSYLRVNVFPLCVCMCVRVCVCACVCVCVRACACSRYRRVQSALAQQCSELQDARMLTEFLERVELEENQAGRGSPDSSSEQVRQGCLCCHSTFCGWVNALTYKV